MKATLEKYGQDIALLVLDTTKLGEGVCAECGATSETYCLTDDLGACSQCVGEAVEYWERRGGMSSEDVLGGLFSRPVDGASRVYRVVMGAYFSTIRKGAEQ